MQQQKLTVVAQDIGQVVGHLVVLGLVEVVELEEVVDSLMWVQF